MIIIKYVSCLKKFVWDFKRGDQKGTGMLFFLSGFMKHNLHAL